MHSYSLIVVILNTISAELFIPLSDENIMKAELTSSMEQSKPNAELDKASDPFLKEEPANEAKNAPQKTILSQSNDKSDLSELSIKKKEEPEISNSEQKDMLFGSSKPFWTEANVDGKRKKMLVRVKQVTIVDKIISADQPATVAKSTASSSAKKPVSSTKPKAASETPAIRIQMPKGYNASRPSTSSAPGDKWAAVFSPLFKSVGTHALSTSATITSHSSSTTASSTSHPFAGPKTSNKSIPMSIEAKTSAEAKGVPVSIKSSSTTSKPALSASVKLPSTISKTMSSVPASHTATRGNGTTREASKPSFAETIREKLGMNSGAESAKGAQGSKEVAKSNISSSMASKAPSTAKSSEPGVVIKTQDESGLGNIFDILKSMPGSDKAVPKNIFIEGNISFPKENMFKNKSLKVSGYISTGE